ERFPGENAGLPEVPLHLGADPRQVAKGVTQHAIKVPARNKKIAPSGSSPVSLKGSRGTRSKLPLRQTTLQQAGATLGAWMQRGLTPFRPGSAGSRRWD